MLKNKKSFKISTREKAQSQRQLKVSQVINNSLVQCLRKSGKLPLALNNCPLSITKVTMSTDLRVANCFFLPFNTVLTNDDIIKALDQAKYVIRDYVTAQVNLKYSPEIRFFYDAGFENTSLIDNLLSK